MIYKTRPPHKLLEPYVDCIWLLVSTDVRPVPEPEIVLPDGKIELIVHFGDHFEKLESGKKFVKQARTLLSGQLTEKIFLRSTGSIGMVAVRFKPGGSSRFFRFPHDEISDQVLNFRDIAESESIQLQEQILNALTHDEQMLILENFLIGRMEKQNPKLNDSFVLQACRYIVQSGGEYTVNDLVKLTGTSERQLERRFKSEVGLSPKMLLRIARFQRFLSMSGSGKITSLTDAALVCGYYDQAHFIRDFHAFSGVSPTAYLSQTHVISSFFTSSD